MNLVNVVGGEIISAKKRLLRIFSKIRFFSRKCLDDSVQPLGPRSTESNKFEFVTLTAITLAYRTSLSLIGYAMSKKHSNWTLGETFYFFVISSTTVGLGDYVPADISSSSGGLRFWALFIVTLVGLGLVAAMIATKYNAVTDLAHERVSSALVGMSRKVSIVSLSTSITAARRRSSLRTQAVVRIKSNRQRSGSDRGGESSDDNEEGSVDSYVHDQDESATAITSAAEHASNKILANFEWQTEIESQREETAVDTKAADTCSGQLSQ
jgi:hypothetical protein